MIYKAVLYENTSLKNDFHPDTSHLIYLTMIQCCIVFISLL